MIDWRGIIGTSLVHGMAVTAWPIVGFGQTTHCMCWLPGHEAMTTFTVTQPRRIEIFAAPASSDRRAIPLVQSTCRGNHPLASTPTALNRTILPAAMARGGSLAFCATIDAAGYPTRLRVMQAGDRSPATIARIRQRLWAIRFAPARLEGRPMQTRVELRLVG